MRAGSGGKWGAVPDYHPYRATADFNSDGEVDFAVVVADRSKPGGNFALIVFNGPLRKRAASPVFVRSGLASRDWRRAVPAAPDDLDAVLAVLREHYGLVLDR